MQVNKYYAEQRYKSEMKTEGEKKNLTKLCFQFTQVIGKTKPY